MCSATLITGGEAQGRSIIATAAHCVYSREKGKFAHKFLFIPGQDDGATDQSDTTCSNDPYGCFAPKVVVIPEGYKTASTFGDATEFDFAFLLATGGPSYLTPMNVSFTGMTYETVDTHLFGYPADRDVAGKGAQFMHTADVIYSTEHPDLTGRPGYYAPCSGLSGGASGGPWTQTDPVTGSLTLQSVNSWGWVDNAYTGMGSSPFTDCAKTVYEATKAVSVTNGGVSVVC